MRKILKKTPSAKIARAYRRKLAIRKKISGTAECPRVTIAKGNKNIYVQAIDDTKGVTLVSCQTFGKNKIGESANVESGRLIGANLADKLKSKNLSTVVFDRNGLKYCGVVEAVAQSMRDNGITL